MTPLIKGLLLIWFKWWGWSRTSTRVCSFWHSYSKLIDGLSNKKIHPMSVIKTIWVREHILNVSYLYVSHTSLNSLKIKLNLCHFPPLVPLLEPWNHFSHPPFLRLLYHTILVRTSSKMLGLKKGIRLWKTWLRLERTCLKIFKFVQIIQNHPTYNTMENTIMRN